jgi:RNA polymerase sigma-70 factor, ECF subfamily
VGDAIGDPAVPPFSLTACFGIQRVVHVASSGREELLMPHPGTPADVDPTIRSIIRKKIREISGRYSIHPQDHADLEQHLLLRLLERLPKYDRSRGIPPVFASVVVASALANYLRDRSTRKRTPKQPVLAEPNLNDVPDGQAEDLEQQTDLALDMAAFIASLPAELRPVANALMFENKADAARSLGRPRTSLGAPIDQLRTALDRAGLRDYL